MYCQNCGVENTDNARFCKACGYLMNSSSPVRTPPKRNKFPLVFLLVPLAVLLVVLAAFGIRRFFGGRQAFAPCTLIGYDDMGNKLWEEKINQYGETTDSWEYSNGEKKEYVSFKYEYDNRNRTVRKEFWRDNQMESYEINKYQGDTRITETFDSYNDQLVGTATATLNKKGLPTKIQFYTDGNLVREGTYTYDKHGWTTKIEFNYYDGSISGDRMTVVRDFTYEKGRPVSARSTQVYHEEDGQESTTVQIWEFIYE